MQPFFFELESLTNEHSIGIKQQVETLTGPMEISFDVTYKCPFNCLHCFNCSGDRLSRNELSDNELIEVAKQIADIKPLGVCLCGGEPMLRGETLYKIIEILARARINVNMVSNGYLMTYEKLVRLRNAGLNGVQFSVDGSNATSHEKIRLVKGSYDKVINAIKMSKEIGIRDVGVAFSPTAYNIEEFEDFLENMQELGVSSIRSQPIMPLGDGLANIQDLLPTESQYRQLAKSINLHNINYHIDSSPGSVSVQWGDPIDHLIRFSNVFPEPSYLMEIKADGFIGVSSYLGLSVGNVKKHTLREYWEAGYKRIWSYSIVKTLANQLTSLSDMAYVKPLSFMDDYIRIDIIDNSAEEIEVLTKHIEEIINGTPTQQIEEQMKQLSLKNLNKITL